MIWPSVAKKITAIGSGPATLSALKCWAPEKKVLASAHNSVLEAAATRGLFGVLGLFALLVAPQMAGLWTVAMFNPISFEVVFIACILVGITKQRG
jgi:O-antigen ligase